MDPPGGHMFRIGISWENMKKTFLSETTRARALIFGVLGNVCVWWGGEGLPGSCYVLKDHTTEETSLIALHQMV